VNTAPEHKGCYKHQIDR
jgi:hypothetical protein